MQVTVPIEGKLSNVMLDTEDKTITFTKGTQQVTFDFEKVRAAIVALAKVTKASMKGDHYG